MKGFYAHLCERPQEKERRGGARKERKTEKNPREEKKHLIRLFSQFLKKIQKQIFLFY